MLLARTPSVRIPHVLGVEGMAVVLARRWGIDPGRCILAALLHDLVKPFPKDRQREMLALCRAVPPTAEDHRHPSIWHGLIAAQEAMERWGISDTDVLEAVAHHSTGRRGMGDVGLVLYVADFTEPSRNWPGVEEARTAILAGDLRAAARDVARRKLVRLKERGKDAHSLSQEMADWLNADPRKG